MPSTTEAEKAAKEQAYLDLQWVVPYHSQRDNKAVDTMYIKIVEKYNEHGDLVLKKTGVRETTYTYNEKWELLKKKECRCEYTMENGKWNPDKQQSDCCKDIGKNFFSLDGTKKYDDRQFWFDTPLGWDIKKSDMPLKYQGESYFKEILYSSKECLEGNKHCKKEVLTTKFYGGKIGDIMCNLTSVSMGLEYFGISKPCPDCHSQCNSKDQFEDYLECERKASGFGERNLPDTWTELLEKFGMKGKIFTFSNDTKKTADNSDLYSIMHTKEELTAEEKETKKNNRINSLKEEINGELKKGNSVLMSLFPPAKGHIVRVVSVSDEGIVFDDPYGKLTPTGFINRQKGATGYKKESDRNNPKVESPKNRGMHVLYTWTDLTNSTIKYYYVINKED
jgi:hypothetical protein